MIHSSYSILCSYSYLPHRPPAFDDMPFAKGAAFYVINKVSNRGCTINNFIINFIYFTRVISQMLKEADYALCATLQTVLRAQKVDFSASFTSTQFGIIVPYPKDNVNVAASVKPFSFKVLSLTMT